MSEPQRLSPTAQVALARANPPKPGRKTKQEEVEDYLRALGVDPEDVLGDREPWGERPASIEEFSERALDLLWKKLPTFKETALTQSVKIIRDLAIVERNEPDVDVAETDVLDVIQADGLSAERKRELLTAERARVAERLARIDKNLEEL